MKVEKIKASYGSIHKYIETNRNNQVPFLKVYKRLTDPILTAAEVKNQIGFTQRQVNYQAKILFADGKKKRSGWRRYNLLDLVALKFIGQFNRVNYPDPLIMGHYFRWLRTLLIDNYELLIHVSLGREVKMIHHFSRPHPQLYVLPEQTRDFSEKILANKQTTTVFHLEKIIQDQLTVKSTHGFSADKTDKNTLIYKIDADKLEVKNLPENVIREAIRKNELNNFSLQMAEKLFAPILEKWSW